MPNKLELIEPVITKLVTGQRKTKSNIDYDSNQDCDAKLGEKAKAGQMDLKRLVDVVLALVLAILLFPIILLISCLVMLDSPGPVLFRQKRLGLNGKPFEIIKFRKFPHDWGTKGPMVTMANDVRMTRIGHFLERTKLDELPQLWNILKGEMSFVGPRPESLRYEKLFTPEFEEVLTHLPGIFGPNQIKFRNESMMYPADQDPESFYETNLFPQKARNDIQYFRQATLWQDIQWILRGIGVSVFSSVIWSWRTTSTLLLILVDMLAIEIGWLTAYMIRFDGVPADPEHIFISYLTGTWIFPLVVLPCLYFAGTYRNPIRFFSESDSYRLIFGASIGWAVGFLLLLGFFTRSASIVVGPIGFFVSLLLMIVPRITYRNFYVRRFKSQTSEKNAKRILLYGAGRRGIAASSFLVDGFPGSTLVGFVDDYSAFSGRTINGQKVLGSERDLDSIKAKTNFSELWLMFEPHPTKHNRLRQWAQDNNVRLILFTRCEPFSGLMGRTDQTEPSAAD